MTQSVSQNGNDGEHRAKVITITNVGPRWNVDFEGVVTRKDIHRINRILTVEFSRAQRRYSLQRKNNLKKSSMENVTDASC